MNNRIKTGIFYSIFGIIMNLFVSLAKILLGIITTSVAIIASGINNLTDMASSVITLIGFKLSNKAPDANHPYGHERIEYISGLFVSFLVLLAGVLVVFQSFKKIFLNEEMQLSKTFLIISILVVSLLIKLIMFFIYRRGSIKIKSVALKATAWDTLFDAVETFVVLVGVLISKYMSINLDGYLGILVGLFIIYNGINLIIESSVILIGTKDHSLCTSLEEFISSFDGVLGNHDLYVHSYGPSRKIALAHVEVDSRIDVLVNHDLIDRIEREAKEKFGIQLVLHMDPVDLNNEYANKLREELDDIIGKYPKTKYHDFRVFETENEIKVSFDIVYPDNCSLSKNELKKNIEKEIIKRADKKNKPYRIMIDIDDCF